MKRSGGTAVAMAMAVALAACGVEGGADEARRTTARPPASTTEPRPSSTTTEPGGDEPDPGAADEQPASEAIPWSEVVAATQVRTGTLEKIAGAMWDDTGEFVEDTVLEEAIAFDQDRSLVERTVTIDSDLPGVPEGPLRFAYAGDEVFLSAPWVEEACGTEWVPMDGAMDEAGIGDLFDAELLLPLDPLGPLAVATPDLPPAEVTETWTTYDVDVPATLAIASNYRLKAPQVWEALSRETISAAVTIDRDGEIEVEVAMPFSMLEEAGDEEVAEVPGGVSLWARWNLQDAGVPSDLTEPSDVAEDASCAE